MNGKKIIITAFAAISLAFAFSAVGNAFAEAAAEEVRATGGSGHSDESAGIGSCDLTLVTVNASGRVQALADMGLDIVSVRRGRVEILASRGDLAMISAAGFEYASRGRGPGGALPDIRLPGTGFYHTYDQMLEIMRETASSYPGICRMVSIGKSVEGRDIYAMNVSGEPSSGARKPAGLLMGLHHGREWISAEVPLAILKELTSKYPSDGAIRNIVDNRDIWIVPVVNPDGLVYSQTNTASWRKNRRRNSDGSYGVDPNRNYGYQWGSVGASNTMSSNTYHGPNAFSEPCTSAIKKLAAERRFVGSISFHSYMGQVLYPYGYSAEALTNDDALLSSMASDMAAINGYFALKSSKLYEAMGDSDDFLYGSMGVLPFTIELGTTNVTPPETEAVKICSDSVKVSLYLLGRIGTVHASNHPDHASVVAVAMSRYVYAASVSGGKDPDAAVQLACLLDPSNDRDQAMLDEFVSAAASMDPKAVRLFAPVLKSVRAAYMGRAMASGENARAIAEGLEKISEIKEMIHFE